MTKIHPTAIISASATIAESAIIGPYCTIGSNVILGEDVELVSHVCISGRTKIGNKTKIFPFASIGSDPQDLKFQGELSQLIIGSSNVIREHVTMNPGTNGGGLLTEIGNNCLFMVGSHVAHDCRVGDQVILVNNATLGGHVEIGDWALVGGLSAIHQFVRIGKHAMVGGMSGVENNVIPYGSVIGNRARLSGLNIVGLKRRGFSRDEIHDLRKAYRLIFAEEGTLTERLEDVEEDFANNEPVLEILEFIRRESSRSICQPGLEDVA